MNMRAKRSGQGQRAKPQTNFFPLYAIIFSISALKVAFFVNLIREAEEKAVII